MSEKKGFFGKLFGGSDEGPPEDDARVQESASLPEAADVADNADTKETTDTAKVEEAPLDASPNIADSLSDSTTDPITNPTTDLTTNLAEDPAIESAAAQTPALENLPPSTEPPEENEPPKKKGFFNRLFGNDENERLEEEAAPDAPPPSDNLEPHPQEEDTAPRSDAQDSAPQNAPVETTPTDENAAPDDILETIYNDDVSAPDEEPVASAPAQPIAPDLPLEDTAHAEATPPEEQPEKKQGFFGRLRQGLSKTSHKLTGGVSAIFTKRRLDDDTLEELEDLLITADLGMAATMRITTALAKDKFDKEVTDEEVKTVLANEIVSTLGPLEQPLTIEPAHQPHIILMTGVNGAGKTTTIGKLARKYRDEGKSVMLAAGDTFRAAAIEQLTVWGERVGAPVISRDVGADAAGLVFDAIKAAQDQKIDVLMIDTAGRLQNRTELMDELAKIVRVIRKIDETAPHNTLLVLDATVGQNALSQTEVFTEIAGVSGLVMTKLDGTARGGVLVALADKFEIPIHYIGVGEGVEDLQPFNAHHFARALTGLEEITRPS